MKTTGETVIFNVRNPIEVMFYTGAIAYPHQVRGDHLDQVLSNGYTAVLYRHHGRRRPREPLPNQYPGKIIFLD